MELVISVYKSFRKRKPFTIKVLGHSYASIKRCLEHISQNIEEKSVVRVEAASFAEKLDLLENGILLTFWLDILHRTNDINKALQQDNMDLSTTSNLLSSLAQYFQYLRNEFDQYEAKGIAGNEKYIERRSTERKRHFGEPNTEVILDPRKKIRSQIYLPILDNLQTEIIHRSEAYKTGSALLEFLFNLKKLSDKAILLNAQKLKETYMEDLDERFPQEFSKNS
ncbi:unnamed protein product [Psylliodes chrysocephalus]|uniref:Uncharacterized protein n=1 Tax=Psylliodes chrysocephalus TaxID=3402493 RepID=A0A9P0G9H6_9CUCU|nr:unnamed protein product [Psylliodes chrysocephala]